MLFSRSKKREPQETEDLTESKLHDLLEEMHRQKSDILTYLSAVEKERLHHNETDNRIQKINDSITEVNDNYFALEEKIELFSENSARLDTFNERIDHINERFSHFEHILKRLEDKEDYAEVVNKKIDAVIERLKNEEEESFLERCVTTIDTLEKKVDNLSEQTTAAQEQNNILTEKLGTAEELVQSLENSALSTKQLFHQIDNKIKEFTTVKNTVEHFQKVADHVDKKIGELENQRRLLEKLDLENKESVKHAWHIEADLEKLKSAEYDIDKIQDKLAHVDSLYQTCEDATKRIEAYQRGDSEREEALIRFYSVYDEFTHKIQTVEQQQTELDELSETIGKNLSLSEEVSEVHEALEKKRKEFEDHYKDLTVATETMIAQKDIINDTVSTVEGMKDRIDELQKALTDENSEDLDISILSSLDDKVKDIKENLAKLSEREHALAEQEEHIQKLSDKIENAKNQLTELDEKYITIAEISKQTEHIPEKLETFTSSLSHEQKRIENLKEKVDSLDSVQNSFGELVSKFSKVEQQVSEQQEKISIVEKTEKRLNHLNFMLGDINVKIRGLSEREEALKKLDSQCAFLTRFFEDSKGTIEMLQHTNNTFFENKEHYQEILTKGEELFGTLREDINKYNTAREQHNATYIQNNELLTEVKAVKIEIFQSVLRKLEGLKKLGKEFDKVDVFHKRLDKYYSEVVKYEEAITTKIQKLAETQENIKNIADKVDKIEEYKQLFDNVEQSMKEFEHKIIDTDRRIKTFHQKAEEIQLTGKKVKVIDLSIDNVKEHLAELAAEKAELVKAKTELSQLRTAIHEARQQQTVTQRSTIGTPPPLPMEKENHSNTSETPLDPQDRISKLRKLTER